MPDSYAQSPDGLLFVTNGVDGVLVYDGLGPVQPAGLLAPAAGMTLAGSGAGSITGDYSAYVRFKDARGNVSNFSPVTGPTTLSGSGAVVYSGVPVPAQAKVTRRQILRNTAQQAAVYYVDVDTDDLSSTSFTSTKDDTTLAAQESQALFTSSGELLANSHDPPPATKTVMAHHLDRMYLAGEVEYREGSAAVAAGGATVAGVGTRWPATFAGRFLWVDGATRSYEILSVDADLQTLTLTEAYGSASNPYATYAIRPPAAERRLVYYSNAGEPESWPPTQALSVQEDGDEITGLMPRGSFIYVLERSHVYRFTTQSDPATDGYLFQAGNRGCVNNRCWVVIDDDAYFLDEQGVYAFSGGQDAESLTAPVQDLFEPDGAYGLGARYRINWRARSLFHAVYHPGQNTIRWFVALSGSLPRHALCLSLLEKRWWLEEYPVPITSSALARLNGLPRPVLGGPGGEVYLMGEGTLDGAAPGPTLRGAATSAGPLTLADTSADFTRAADTLAGAPVVIVSGRGAGQRRKIAAAGRTSLEVTAPWSAVPGAGSVYQIGGISYRWMSKTWRYRDDDREQPRRVELLFEPCTRGPSEIELRLYQDRSRVALAMGSTGGADPGVFGSTAGEPDLVGDLASPAGYLQRRLDGRKDLYAEGPRFLSVGLSGVTNLDPVVLFELGVDGVR